MILPITAYGTPVLRQMAENITADYPQLSTIIANMWDTMYHAKGVGLAAPQVGLSIRLFVVDTEQIKPDDDDDDDNNEPIDEVGIKKVFINAQLLDKTGKKYAYNEGCLSIPFVREDVTRPETITLQYLDENFNEHTETYSGLQPALSNTNTTTSTVSYLPTTYRRSKNNWLNANSTKLPKAKCAPITACRFTT